MATQALLLADDPGVGEWLSAHLGGNMAVLTADHVNPAAFVDELAGTPGTALVFVEFAQDNATARAATVEQVLARFPDFPVVAVGAREDSGAVLPAMRAGARDFLVIGRDDEHCRELVERALRKPGRSAGSRAGDGQVLAVVSAQADPATAFLAVHIALALQEAGPRRVLLLDLTVPGGASLVFLDAEQSYHALDALGDVDRCDQTLIDTAFARFRDGLYLLCLPEECVAPPAVEAEQLGRLLDGFTGFFDHVVVVADTGIGLTPLAAVCSRARKTLLLTDQSVLRSRRNKQLLHALRRCDCPLDSLGLVVDHGQAKAGMEAERLAGLLEVPLVGSLDGRLSVRVEAMNAGESLFDHAPRDGYCRDVLALLDTLGSEAVAPGGRGGVMQRWFGT